MNSLANLHSVVDDHGDSTPWPSDQGWDPPVASICTGSLSESRLHFHHSVTPRQEWDWSEGQMILAPHYGTEDDELDCKSGVLHAETMGGSGATGLGLRQYSTGLVSAAAGIVTPLIGGGGGAAVPSSWPGLLNAVPLRQQQIGLESSGGGSCYSPSALVYGGGLGAGGHGGNNTGLGSYYSNTHQNHMLDMEQRRMHDILKRGMYSNGGDLGSSRLGLNLGGRTYFSTEDMSARFQLGAGKRFRPNSPSLHVPLCQAEGCKADLSIAKHYHRRHKVCEYHSKASTVNISGNTQRFCQQCSRFHGLMEFDEGKRSCRKRLADHNRRRRKPQPAPALPAADSATPTAQGASSGDNPTSKQHDDEMQDSKPVARCQSGQQGGQQSKEGMAVNKTASSSSTEQPTTSLLSPMTLAPSVSLTLQNGGSRSDLQSNHSGNMPVCSNDQNHEKEAAYINERHSLAPYLLNGPSLSLSSNTVGSAGASVGGDSAPSTNHQSPVHAPVHAPPTFNEVELSVPWLRGHHVSSSSRVGLVQESLGKLSTCHQAEEGSIVYNNTNTSSRRNTTGQYFNEHGRLLAEHMQNMQSQVRNTAGTDHHHVMKRENWLLEGAVAHEEQTVLSLLETATSNGSTKKESHAEYNRQIGGVPTMNADHPHPHLEETHQSAGARHPLDFLQQHHHHHSHGGLHLGSASPSDMDHEASDAAHSLHCMQVLRPLNESLYTTADFMKDGFV